MNEFMNSFELAEMLGVTEGTIRNWRNLKTGPPFLKLGKTKNSKIRYATKDVRDWIRKQTRLDKPKTILRKRRV